MSQGLSLDLLHGVVEEALGRGAADGFNEVWAFGAKADPFFESETFEVGGVVAVGDGGSFENERSVVVVAVVNEVKLGVARGGDDFFDDESVDGLAGCEVGRKRKLAELTEDVVFVVAGQGVDAEDQAGAIVGAVFGLVAEGLGGLRGIGMSEEAFADGIAREEIVDAIGG